MVQKVALINILLDKNISVYNIPYKPPTGPKPLRIRFYKIDRFIISLNGKTKH